MYLLALRLAEVRDVMDRAQLKPPISDLKRLPHMIAELLERDVQGIDAIARAHHRADFFLYLGRHVGLPVALEGALKLKEISYIHAEGYPAGEMKHGPIALIDRHLPVVCIAPRDALYEKMLSNIEQVRTRGGQVIAIVTEGDMRARELADVAIEIPETLPLLTPLLTTIPLQLLAYQVAVRRGADVDQPRNLAKSVTVE
ncbi:MAG TPA: SIS domain-containing protein, partial [Roseiflexaceae bacterium]|nr:SIS domain-containing protein [Roseiflexaceae bacterium]